jgi:hypothetical protein
MARTMPDSSPAGNGRLSQALGAEDHDLKTGNDYGFA